MQFLHPVGYCQHELVLQEREVILPYVTVVVSIEILHVYRLLVESEACKNFGLAFAMKMKELVKSSCYLPTWP